MGALNSTLTVTVDLTVKLLFDFLFNEAKVFIFSCDKSYHKLLFDLPFLFLTLVMAYAFCFLCFSRSSAECSEDSTILWSMLFCFKKNNIDQSIVESPRQNLTTSSVQSRAVFAVLPPTTDSSAFL